MSDNEPDTRLPTPLEVALRPGAKPWPNCLRDNITELERPYRTHPPVIDENLANPLRDHAPRTAPGRKVRRVLEILNDIENQNINRRFNP